MHYKRTDKNINHCTLFEIAYYHSTTILTFLLNEIVVEMNCFIEVSYR